MNAALSDQIVALPTLEKTQLLKLWAEYFHQPAFPKMRRKFLISLLAYRMQEKEYGGLSHQARKKLKEVAGAHKAGRARPEKLAPVPQQETRFIRSWHGEIHEVVASEDGYQYRGERFGSLSKIARIITGTQWSGPVFFGARKAK